MLFMICHLIEAENISVCRAKLVWNCSVAYWFHCNVFTSPYSETGMQPLAMLALSDQLSNRACVINPFSVKASLSGPPVSNMASDWLYWLGFKPTRNRFSYRQFQPLDQGPILKTPAVLYWMKFILTTKYPVPIHYNVLRFTLTEDNIPV